MRLEDKKLIAHASEKLIQNGVMDTKQLDSFILINENKNIDYSVGAVCYSSFRTKVVSKPKFFGFFHATRYLDMCNITPCSNTAARSYFHWLFRESPYSRLFVFKDKNRPFDKIVFLNTDATPQMVISAAIACRYRVEHPRIITTWYELKKLGINKNLAYMFAHFLNYKDDKFYVDLSFKNSNHIVYQYYYERGPGSDSINGFILGKERQGRKLVSEGNKNYVDLETAFSEPNNRIGPFTYNPNDKFKVTTTRTVWGDVYKAVCLEKGEVEAYVKDFCKCNGWEWLS